MKAQLFSSTGTESCSRRAACHRGSAWSWGLSQSQTSLRNLKTACRRHRHTYRVLKPEFRWKSQVLLIHKCCPGLILPFPHFSLSLFSLPLPFPEGHYQPQNSRNHHIIWAAAATQGCVGAFQQQQRSHIHTKSSGCGKGFRLLGTQLSAERSLLRQPEDSHPSPVAVAESREALHGHKPNKIHLGISSYLLAFPVHSAALIPQWLPGCCISLMRKQAFCCYYKTNYLMHEWP